MTEKKELGNKGEELAKEFYEKNNYRVLETQWRFGHLEVDIIAANLESVVFCEVKTRSSSTFGRPEEFVTKQKQRNLIRAANSYIARHRIDKEVRFDIIAILREGGQFELQYIPNAFTPRW